MDENQVVEEETTETEEIVEEKARVPKGAIVAGVAAAGVGIACGVKWLIGKIRNKEPYYDYSDEADFEEVDCTEIEISEE